jgi:hypothetical protein
LATIRIDGLYEAFRLIVRGGIDFRKMSSNEKGFGPTSTGLYFRLLMATSIPS